MPTADILIIEDDATDSLVLKEALSETAIAANIAVVSHVDEALKYLNNKAPYEKAPRPDLILMDLKMPHLNGHDLLLMIKRDMRLKHIPIIVLTSSKNENDIMESYQLQANCYIVKPNDVIKFKRVVGVINDFWLGIAKLPPKEKD